MWYHYLWWVPLTIIIYFGYGWLSTKNNTSDSFRWLVAIYLYGGLFQIWAFVSKVSQNLIFDALLFDSLMAISFLTAVLIIKGTLPTFYQGLGVVLCVIGFLMIR